MTKFVDLRHKATKQTNTSILLGLNSENVVRLQKTYSMMRLASFLISARVLYIDISHLTRSLLAATFFVCL